MRRADLEAYLDQYLEIGIFRDYCPNGLQVEGRDSVDTIVTGVTASLALIEQAIAARADALLVHHGYFWRGEDARLTGVRLARKPLVLGDAGREVRKVAWCTGAAQSYLEETVRLGVDVFVSGEISEQTVHLARASGVAFGSAGHHATERYGIAALGGHLAERFGVTHRHIDVPNPA
jgi:putative NIF3 family GTP cyclohydrolase 1 type 2